MKLRFLPQLLFNLKIKSPSPLYFEIVCPNLGFIDSAMLADQLAPKDTPVSVFITRLQAISTYSSFLNRIYS